LCIRYQKEIIHGEAQPPPEGVGQQEENVRTSGNNTSRSPIMLPMMEGRVLSLSGGGRNLSDLFFSLEIRMKASR
jgi:hypothetical protein